MINTNEYLIKVWDGPTRLFHWSIVFFMLASWVTIENGLITLHLYSGLILFALIIFRILWGFVGSTTARFSDFVTMPQTAIYYIKTMSKPQKNTYGGHNPAGGFVVLAFLALLFLQVITGLFSNDDINFNSPLATIISKNTSDSLTEIHSKSFNFILLLVWMHIVAVFYYLCVKGENLVWPMLTGKKRSSHLPANSKFEFVHPFLALLLFALVLICIWLIFLSSGEFPW